MTIHTERSVIGAFHFHPQGDGGIKDPGFALKEMISRGGMHGAKLFAPSDHAQFYNPDLYTSKTKVWMSVLHNISYFPLIPCVEIAAEGNLSSGKATSIRRKPTIRIEDNNDITHWLVYGTRPQINQLVELASHNTNSRVSLRRLFSFAKSYDMPIVAAHPEMLDTTGNDYSASIGLLESILSSAYSDFLVGMEVVSGKQRLLNATHEKLTDLRKNGLRREAAIRLGLLQFGGSDAHAHNRGGIDSIGEVLTRLHMGKNVNTVNDFIEFLFMAKFDQRKVEVGFDRVNPYVPEDVNLAWYQWMYMKMQALL